MIEVIVGIIVRDAKVYREGKVLLVRRAPHKSFAGKWEFPSVKTEPANEDLSKRDVAKLLATDIGIYTMPLYYLDGYEYVYPDHTIVLSAYLCDYVDGDFLLIDHAQTQWVQMQDLVRWDLAEEYIPMLKVLKDGMLIK